MSYLEKFFSGWRFRRKARLADGATVVTIEIPGPLAAHEEDQRDAKGRNEAIRWAAGLLHGAGLITNEDVQRIQAHLNQEPSN